MLPPEEFGRVHQSGTMREVWHFVHRIDRVGRRGGEDLIGVSLVDCDDRSLP
jgi:hypothetical protein